MNNAPFLVVHHKSRYRGFYDVVLDWVSLNLPGQRELFESHALPWSIPKNHHHRLMIPWLQDPVEQWCRRTYDQSLQLTAECDAQNIPVINRPELLARAGKSSGARLMGRAGLRSPLVAQINDPAKFREDFGGLTFPFFVREDCGHGGEMIRVDTATDVRAIHFHRFKKPVAIQIIDLRDAHDGLYRKYRYVVAGDWGVPHHLQVSTQWITRGGNRVVNQTTRSQELTYIEAPCPHHEAFQRARQALGLDYVAFDYSLDSAGKPVVWEANPYPYLHFSRGQLEYRNEAMHRTIATLVAFYFQRANVPLPTRLTQYLAGEKCLLPKANSTLAADSLTGCWQIPPHKERFALKRAADWVRDALRALRKK